MALKDAPMVEVLKFDEAEAYDHDRRISSLIRTQLLHLHHAENLVVPSEARTNININHLLTERQASEYIQRVTRLLHEYGKASSGSESKMKRETPAKKTARTSGKKKDSRSQSKRNNKTTATKQSRRK